MDALEFLHETGYQLYIYAPKADPWLRSRWREEGPPSWFGQLRRLAGRCRELGLAWGLGLSPLGVRERELAPAGPWAARLEAIAELAPDWLCILFDDMPGGERGLATRQLRLMDTVLAGGRFARLALCPSYYSHDPVLEERFGPRPRDYWRELGRELPASVEIFWTGERVCSASYRRQHFEQIGSWLRRPPLLWDNYPVNDGARLSRRLHLQGFRLWPGLRPWLRGHCVNPMNQAWLSRIPLRTLAPLYRNPETYRSLQATRAALTEECSAGLATALARDLRRFAGKGLDGLSRAQRLELLAEYRRFDQPHAREVVDWLQGDYRFDPSCLNA